MKVIEARNVHEAFPKALTLLRNDGMPRDSRNGPVEVVPYPVATVYGRPMERVIFWSERDANPFFHLYESLWMLAGSNDVESVAQYAANMRNYSDDGKTLHGAYGNRWRFAYDPMDQLAVIAERLRLDKTDRRAVLQMWDAGTDLEYYDSKDLPCNLTATFQVNVTGCLNLVVFCRSNDILWGAYGANAVHFSMLHEYMSIWTGYPMGTYTQVSVNWHAYKDKLKAIGPLRVGDNPYLSKVHFSLLSYERGLDAHKWVDEQIAYILDSVENKFSSLPLTTKLSQFWSNTYHILLAHALYKETDGPKRFDVALEELSRVASTAQSADWVVAAREWIERRKARYERDR